MHQSDPLFPCPCCGFPSLPCARVATCLICWWEEIGIEEDPDEISGGPNSGYSLNMARANFRHHGHMYDADNPIAYLKDETATRASMMRYVRTVQDGKIAMNQNVLAGLLRTEQETIRTLHPETGYDPAREEEMLKALMNITRAPG